MDVELVPAENLSPLDGQTSGVSFCNVFLGQGQAFVCCPHTETWPQRAGGVTIAWTLKGVVSNSSTAARFPAKSSSVFILDGYEGSHCKGSCRGSGLFPVGDVLHTTDGGEEGGKSKNRCGEEACRQADKQTAGGVWRRGAASGGRKRVSKKEKDKGRHGCQREKTVKPCACR